ncbi:MAG: hypothetical protein A2X64_00785 [Ignavibacteria bacterium GWF2_33_9]|nr:MAG: hypothetical protein A2X64_00785 [Ignavibacteria bacterium GWF2_33_9]
MGLVYLNLKLGRTRPKFKLELSNFDKLLEVTAMVVFIYLWYLVLTSYGKLPEQIATHFDSSGKVNDVGSKITILIFPIIATFIYALLSIINKFPHTFNYLTEITEQNAPMQYKLATQLIRYLKATIMVTFAFISHAIITDAQSTKTSLGFEFLPIFLGAIFLPMIYYFVRMIKNK